MRPILAILVAVTILGGLSLYMSVRRSAWAGRSTPVIEIAPGRFDVEVTLTFEAGPDPFALSATDAPSLSVLLAGTELLRETDTIESGKRQTIQDVQGLEVGTNEFLVQANPADTSGDLSRALRVRILRDLIPVADQTIWSEPGQRVEGVILVDLTSDTGLHTDGHDGAHDDRDDDLGTGD